MILLDFNIMKPLLYLKSVFAFVLQCALVYECMSPENTRCNDNLPLLNAGMYVNVGSNFKFNLIL